VQRVGFHAGAWGGDHLLAALSSLSRCGFRHFEVAGDVTHVFAERPEEFGHILGIAGVALAGVHGGGTLTDPDYHEAEAAEWGRMLAWLESAKGAYAVYYGGDAGTDPDAEVEHAAALLDRLGAIAVEHGVRFCYEPMPGGPFGAPDRLTELLSRTDASQVALSVDTARLHQMGIDPAMFLLQHAERVHVVNLRDLADEGDTQEFDVDPFVDPGSGRLDLIGVVDTLRGMRHDGYVIGVVDNPRVSPMSSASRTAAYMRDVLRLTL
jgi:sugar phosphate isomerase/epimerase